MHGFSLRNGLRLEARVGKIIVILKFPDKARESNNQSKVSFENSARVRNKFKLPISACGSPTTLGEMFL